MPPDAKDSFVLFDVGLDESMLKLGDLVLYNYNDPLAAHHYTCQRRPGANDTASTRFSEFSTFHKNGPRTGIQLDAAGFIKLGASFKYDTGKLVVAESAERVILRNPSEYLKTVVLADKSAREALAIWSSAGLSDRLLKFKWARSPKIWMMTGMYLFENARIVTVKSQEVGGEAGISSDLVAALTTAPVGGSISGSRATSAEVTMRVPERKVWAAQYQLLNVRYVDPSKASDTDQLSTIALYLTRSKGQLRNSKPSRKSIVIESFEESEANQDLMGNEAEENETKEAEYLEALETAVVDLQDDLKSGSSSDEE